MLNLWSLFNKEERLRVDDLTVDQVKVILLSISARRLHEWYACQEGQNHWLPITSIKEFKDKEEVTATETIPIKAAVGADGLTDPTLLVDFSATKERRSARRYTRKLGFRVQMGPNTYLSQTVDVSMNGLSLETELPPWVPRSFQAQLSLNQEAISINCEKVGPKKLKITGSESWDLIRRWIVNF